MNTMKNDIATPRPWKLNGYLIESSLKTVMRAECDWHGRTPAFNAEQLANAELIIRAVNNFDALLDACKEAMKFFIPSKDKMTEDQRIAFQFISKTIANAEK